MTSVNLWIAVAAGGALGALLRTAAYRWIAVSALVARKGTGTRFGLARATLVVNLTGSFLLGILIAQLAHLAVDAPMRMFWITGFCGSLTTFSTFCADAIELVRVREHHSFLIYVLCNGLLSLVAFSAGLALSNA